MMKFTPQARRVVLTYWSFRTLRVHFCPYNPTSERLPQTARRRPVCRGPRRRRPRDHRSPRLGHRQHALRRLRRLRQGRHVGCGVLQGRQDDVLADVLRPQLHQLRGVPDGAGGSAQHAPLVGWRQRHQLGHRDEVDHQRHPAGRVGRVVEGRGLPRRLLRARGVRRAGRLRHRDHRVDGQLERRLLLGAGHQGDARAGPAASSTSRTCSSRNTAVPKVTGTAKVGSTLTATAGTWSVAGAAYAYQWMANGAAISGATGSTIALTNPLKGKQISVRVTAVQARLPSTAASSARHGRRPAGRHHQHRRADDHRRRSRGLDPHRTPRDRGTRARPR